MSALSEGFKELWEPDSGEITPPVRRRRARRASRPAKRKRPRKPAREEVLSLFSGPWTARQEEEAAASKGHYHLVGAAGVGMNPLAQTLVSLGYHVTGSDRYLDTGQELEVTPKLRRAGIRFFRQDGSGVHSRTLAVIVSTAIEADNPDIVAANRLGVPLLHRSEMLAKLLEDKESIAVTGTSGKTTVTGMVGFLLEQLGDDPTVINGGIVLNWEGTDTVGNVRIGRSKRWVFEADESDRSLLRYRPDWAIITNISADHFDLERSRELFRTFASRVRKGVIDPCDDSAPWPELSASGSRFTYGGQLFHVPLLGRHNAENALQAVMLCERLGYRLEDIAAALARFRGVRRRLDVVGVAGGVTVIDDYAHNPAKIRAAWRAVAPHYRRIFAVWRPHGFTPLSNMFHELKVLFRDIGESCERIYLLPVYYAGGTVSAVVTSATLVNELQAGGSPVELASNYDDLIDRIVARAQPGDAVLIMGARDPYLPALARRLVETLRRRPT